MGVQSHFSTRIFLSLLLSLFCQIMRETETTLAQCGRLTSEYWKEKRENVCLKLQLVYHWLVGQMVLPQTHAIGLANVVVSGCSNEQSHSVCLYCVWKTTMNGLVFRRKYLKMEKYYTLHL